MKMKLLVLSLLFLPFEFFAQVTAYPVPDINQCSNTVFNLNQQTPVVLGDQGPWPSAYEVMYYTSLTGAQTGSAEGAISTMDYAHYSFTGESRVIYIRVMRVSPFASAVTSFTIRNEITPQIGAFPNFIVCGPVILPPPVPNWTYCTGPNGTNPPIENPDHYTMYVYAVNGFCSNEVSFTVTRVPPGPYPVYDVTACESYTLPNTWDVFYYTEANGGGTNLAPGTVITESMTVHVVAAEANSCFTPNSFDIHIGNPEVAQPTEPLYGCNYASSGLTVFDFYSKFAEIAPESNLEFSVHSSLELAEQNEQGLDYDAPLDITSPQTVYVRVGNGGNCYSIVTVDLIPEPCTENYVAGYVFYDAGGNGCTGQGVPFPYAEVVHTAGGESVSTYTGTYGFGDYEFGNVPEGLNTVSVVLPANYVATPSTQDITITGTQGYYPMTTFCVSSTVANVNDVALELYHFTTPRPGMLHGLYLGIRNNGTTVNNATVTLTFDASKMDFTSVYPANILSGTTANTITLNLTGIPPLQSSLITLIFTMKMPPIVAMGDQVTFTAVAEGVGSDEFPENNSVSLTQTVVNSFDPNDITVHEGAFIQPSQANDYLHYTIRFENEGTAEAENVRITNTLDDLLDWSTFQPLADYGGVRISREGANVTFFWEGINLPPNPSHDPSRIGYVTYKIKPLPGFSVGDVISNEAAIYFDFNPAILTNTVTTQIETTFGITENEFDTLQIYPNPSQDVVHIDWKTNPKTIAVAVYDLQGQLILESNREMISGKASVDVSKIESGIYLMKVAAEGKSTVKKWVKL